MPAAAGMVQRSPAGQSAAMFRDRRYSVSLHASSHDDAIAMCAAVNLPADNEAAPEWVHLLPAGEIQTGDGRGPYRVRNPATVLSASLGPGERLPIDENHATDLAAPRGEPAPARGWIVELQSRDDGVWGRVEWTASGRRLVVGRAYRGLSPVIRHLKNGEVTAILRASLVNRPNLRGLTALHQEGQDMTLIEKLLKALGLDANTGEDQLVAHVTAMHAEKAASATALQAAMSPIAKMVGLDDSATAEAVLAGVERLKGVDGDAAAVTALQAELAAVTTTLNALSETTRREKAEAFVDGEVKRGRVGLKPVRDRYVTMHMADPEGAKTLIAAMPVLGAGGSIVPAAPPARDGEISLHAEQLAVARMLGQDPKDYAATLKAEREAAL
ncbi:phage protease [Nitratireductor soli]|uniref:phage protease n=1 Tax=Nitratireductor soli TaxID=1670619 RepID=UPI000A986946|nr:phage protease [Nitratireductor soli]